MRFCLLPYLFFSFFSFSEENQPVLDVPESSEEAVVNVPTNTPPAEEAVNAQAEKPVNTQAEKPVEETAVSAQTDSPPAEQPPEEDEDLSAVLEEDENVTEDLDENVRTLKLKIKAYTPNYKYTVEDKKDPFSKPGALKDVTTLPEDRLHPVEQESIDNIQLRAIIWGRDGVVPRALFETKNRTYTLTENDRIGQEGALIARIETHRIWAMKPVTDPSTGLVSFEPYEKTLSPSGQKQGMELFYER